MSLFAAQHVNAGGRLMGDVKSLILPFVRARAKEVLADGIRKELAGDRSHDMGFGLSEETLAQYRRSGVPKRLPVDLLREVESRLASPIARKWKHLIEKYAVAKEGKLRVGDFNEAMLPRLDYDILPLLMRDSMYCIGYMQKQLDGTERHSHIPDVTLYDGWENKVLLRLRRTLTLVVPLPHAMLRWLEAEGISADFVVE